MESLKRSSKHYIQGAEEPQTEGDSQGWLMTYGDLMTLLLCFFMLFFNMQEQEKEKRKKKEKDKKDMVTVELTKEQLELLKTLEKMSKEEIQKLKERTKKIDEKIEKLKKQMPIDKIAKILDEALKRSEEINKMKQQIKEVLEQTKQTAVVKIIERKEHMEIVFPNKTFFNSGTAKLLPLAYKMFTKFANMFGKMKFPVDIMVEGHTDSDYIKSRVFPSNWELSTARASAVVRLLISRGIPSERLSAKGYADQKPLLPEIDRKGRKIRKNQAYNRRIVLRITKFLDKKKYKKRKRQAPGVKK